MSPKAIERRLRMASELRDLSLSLMKAKILSEDEAARLRKKIVRRTAPHRKNPRSISDFPHYTNGT